MPEMFIDSLTGARRLDYVKDESKAGLRRARLAFLMFCRRNHVVGVRRGKRTLLFSWLDIQAALTRKRVA